MNTDKITTRLLAIASILIVAAGYLTAADDDKVVQLDETVIVGQYLSTDQANALKSPTPIIDVPQSLTIVTEEQLKLQGFNSIGDIINYTPGVSTSQGEGHRDAVVFRGVRSTADFFVDGVRDDVQYYRPLYNVEQIEILRGPNALFFGRGGTGGILNRVIKKGVVGDSFTGYESSVDSFGEVSVSLDHNQSFHGDTAFRINTFYANLDNHRDFYEGEMIGVNPTLKMILSEDTTVDISYEYMDHDRFIDRGIPTGSNGKPVERFKDIVFGDPDINKSTLEAHVVRVTIDTDFNDDLKGRLNASYGHYDKFYRNFYASSYSESSTPNVVTLDGYVDTTVRQNMVLSGDLIGEIETFGIGHTVVAGVESIYTFNDNDRFNTFWDQTSDDNEVFDIQRPLNLRGGVGTNSSGATTTNSFSSSLNDKTEADVFVFSAYLQDEIEVTEWLDVILGARLDRFDFDVDDKKNSVSHSRTDDEISPRLGLVYKPLENVSLYGSYSESFLPRSGEQYASISDSTRALDPNTYENREVGVKWDLAQGLSVTAAIFEIEESSPQVADGDASTLDVIDTETTGFELQVQGMIMDKWYISAGYGYLDGEQVNSDGSKSGLRPRELPEHMFSVWNNYQLTEKFGFGVGLTHQGKSFINNSNTASLPSYTRLDAAAYYDVMDSLRVQLNIENVTDEVYFPNAHSTHQATVGAPINALLTVSGQF